LGIEQTFEDGPTGPLTELTEGCGYFIGVTPLGRCGRCNDPFEAHVDRAARRPVRPRYVAAVDDEDEP
jgi:hypothetical protein